MSDEIGKSILPFKIQPLLEFIMNKKKMNSTDALYYLYSSKLYKELPSDTAKFWYMSTPMLYDVLEKEKRGNRKKEIADSKIMLFLIFCIEQYKEATLHSGEEVISLFKTEGVFDFLSKHYDVLHTQGKAYIVDEIKLFLKHKKKKKSKV